MAPKRSLRKKMSTNRMKADYDRRDDNGGGKKNGVIDWGAAGNPPHFKVNKDGLNKINIIPFEISTKKHPLVHQNKAEIGELDYCLDIFVHKSVGANQVDVVCPKKNYGKRCPICEQQSEFWDSGKEEEAKALKAKRRVIMNVQPIVKGEPQDLAVWDVSHYLFMKELLEEAHECADGEDIVNFADPDDGTVIAFRGTDGPMDKVTYFKSFKFYDREEPVSDEVLESAIKLDQFLTVLKPDEIERIMYAAEDDDEEEDEKPAHGGRHQANDDDEEEDEKPARGRKPRDEDEDDRPQRGAKTDKHAADEDEEERPSRGRRGGTRPAEEPAEEEDSEEEDPEEEDSPEDNSQEEASRNRGKASAKSDDVTECPNGHEFGAGCDKHKECAKCPHWDACMDAQ